MKMGRLMVNNVDDDVLKEFKIKIIRKHGTLRGHFGKEATKALALWLEKEK